LNRDEIRKIVVILIDSIRKMLENQGVKLELSDAATDWLAQLGFDPQFGARPMKRVIQKRILNELSKQILSGSVNKDGEIFIDVDSKGDFIFVNR
jgi:ATP-dependent Clp protease ATP-binding subunit ClpB